MRTRSIGRGKAAAALLVGAALVASACGSSGTSKSSAAGGSGSPGSSSTFVVADTSSVQKLDPAVITNFLDFQALGMIYQTLVTLSSSLQVEPQLATSWHLSNANRTLTFDLRHGVTFDDGSAFTSADVKATFERILAPGTGAAAASYLATVKSITTPDASTVVLHLTRPDSSLLDGLASQNLSIASAKSITAGSLATKPDGTGPYRFASYNPNNSFTVSKDPTYWGKAPTIGTIEFRTIPNEQSVASALQAGTVQMGLLNQPQVVEQLGGAGLTIDKELDLNYRALMIQSKTGPLAATDARLAVQCAINRTDVLQASVLGDGKVVGPVTEGPLASDASAGTCASQNLGLARSYLAKAGMAKGFSFTALTSNELDSTSNAQAVTIQGELAKVGIHMSIDNVAGSDYIQRWLKGDFQAALAENGASPSPYIMYGRYFSTGASLAVPAGYKSSSLASLLERADEATAAPTQKQLYSQFSGQLVDNAVWVWLFNAYDYYALARSVTGFTPSPTGSLVGLATARTS